MVTISFTGDILCSPRMTEACGKDYSSIFGKATKLGNCDYLVGNLETPVAGEALRYTHQRYCFNTPETILDALGECGFDLFTLANNHCMDRGEEGIVQTLQNCHDRGFETIGIYATQEERDRVFVKDFDGLRVAFINYTYGTNAFAHGNFLTHPYMVNLFQPEETRPGSIHLLNDYAQIEREVNAIYGEGEGYEYVAPYLDRLQDDIARAKAAADYVIVVMHSGSQYVQPVDAYSAYLAEKIKQWGADIIVGHHQHIVQESENKDGYLKIFCLGNFLYDQLIEGDGYYFDSPLFNVVFHLSLDKKENGEIEAKKSFSIYTTVKNEQGVPCPIDAYDVYRQKDEVYLAQTLVSFANLFAGEQLYTQVQERYELP